MYPIKKLQDCATIIAGQSPESKYYNSTGEGIPFFQGKADFGELYPKVRVYCSSPTKIAQYNDILLSVKYSLQGTTQGRYLTGGVPPVRFSM